MISIKLLASKLGTAGSSIDEISIERPETYTHTLDTTGRYVSANFSFALQEHEIPFYMKNLLGAHVEVYSPSGMIIWYGFVNSASLGLARGSVSIGPLSDIANKMRVVYTEQDYTVLGVTFGGTEAATDYSSDTDSIEKYGTWLRDVSGGEINTATGYADDLLAIALEEMAWPNVSTTFSYAGAATPLVSVECIGYHRLLDVYTFRCTSPLTWASDVFTVISNVFGDSPNAVIASFTSSPSLPYIDRSNTLTIECKDEDPVSAWSFLRDIVELGDPSNNRWLLYLAIINEQLEPVYKKIPDDPKYEVSLRENTRIMYYGTDTPVDPWSVEPGEWIYYSDLFAGSDPPVLTGAAELEARPEFELIESVTYTAPYDISISGGKLHRLDQQIARIGLASRD